MTTLLDGNVLIALTVDDHVHHDAAERWFSSIDGGFATCPITQGSLIRLLLRNGQDAQVAVDVLGGVTSRSGHEFWPDTLSYTDVGLTGVIGHRQVTDAYLAALARQHTAQLATLDSGLADLHSDVAALVPVTWDGAEY